jgi:hypothetical protein
MENQEPVLTNEAKPKWLEYLAAESWQVEMIISGIAIVGTLQLPSLLYQAIDWTLYNFSDENLDLFYLFFTYLTLAISVLIFNFIAHFLLRSLWVGMLGLASVYPQGINEKSKNFGEYYLSEVKKDYGDLSGYSVRLDQTASLFFALSFLLAIMMFCFSIFVLAVIVLSNLVLLVFPDWSQNYIFFVFFGILALGALTISVLNSQWLKTKPFIQKLHYRLSKRMNFILYHIFQEPVSYISLTFYTNLSKGRFSKLTFFYFAIVMPILFYIFVNSNVFFMMTERYFTNASNPLRIYPQHYADQQDPKSVILAPFIPSYHQIETDIPLFLPLPKRELSVVEKKLGKYKNDPKLSEDKNLDLDRAYDMERLQRYFTIKVNGKVLEKPNYYFYTPDQRLESGTMTHIPARLLKAGQNTIEIESLYTYKGKKKKSHIVFEFSPPGSNQTGS